MLCCYISDQLLNQYSLTNSGSSEQTNLTTFCIWCKKVDDLDTCLKNLDSRTLLFKCRRLSVDFPALCIFLYFFSIIDGEMDEYPEAAFFNVGTIDEVIEKAKTLKDGE